MSAPVDIAAALHGILKRYDRIGFGRRGVLDAERDLQQFAAALAPDDRARFMQIIVSWIDGAEAARVTASLHYNLPEHLQALAIRLCASLPMPETLSLLRRLQAEGAFPTDNERVCREALRESIARLS